MTKVFVVLTAVLSIALSCLFIASAAQWANYKELADTNLIKRDAAVTLAHATTLTMETELATKREGMAALTRELDSARETARRLNDRNAQLERDLGEVKNERLAFEAGRTKLQEILDVSTAELKSRQIQNETLLTQNIDASSRNARLNARVLELTTSVAIQQDEIRNVKEKLHACEQYARGGRPSMPGSAAQAEGAVNVVATTGEQIRGRITDVSETYASVDVGESSGVASGMMFMIYRPDVGYLGDLVIEKVFAGQAGGRLSTLVQGAIQAGDQVVFGLK